MLPPQTNAHRLALSLDGLWDLALAGAQGVSGDFVTDRVAPVPSALEELYCEAWWLDAERDVCYRRVFELPAIPTDRRWSLWFGGVSYRAEVWIDGERVGEHETGHTPFEVPLPASCRLGRRIEVRVRVTQTLSADTVPMGNLMNTGANGQFAGQYPDVPFDFFPFTGIHRSVHLVAVAEQAQLSKLDFEPTLRAANIGHIALAGRVRGDAHLVECRVAELGWSCSAVVEEGTFQLGGEVGTVNPWDVGQPRLYDVEVRLIDAEGVVVDSYQRHLGFRSIEVVGAQLKLNGRAVRLTGFGKHEDFAVVGRGGGAAVTVRDFALMAWTGANSFRTSHYPYAEETLDLADRLGVLVIAEAPAVSINFEFTTERTLETHLRCVEELIARDRHHPSVIMWSVANESLSTHAKARPYFRQITARARELDATRPLIGVTCHGAADTTLDLYDLVGVNLYPGWYELPGRLAQAEDRLEEILRGLHEVFPGPIMITETGADAVAGFHSLPARQWSEEYQAELIERLFRRARTLPFMMGEHVWNFADFATAQNFPRALGNRKGVFTRDRQPKLAAHRLRSWWHEADETAPTDPTAKLFTPTL